MYSWLRDGLIPGASALLETLWLYALFSFFLATGESTSAMRYPFPWLLALILLPALIGRFLDRSNWGPARLRQYGLTTVVVVSFVGFMLPYHAVGVAWLAAGVLLARGIWLAFGEITAQSAAGWFLAGFGAFLGLLGLLVIAHVSGYEADRRQLGPMLALYLLLGLSWLALVREQEMEERAFRRAANALNGTWLGLLAGMSAAMIGAVALVTFGGSGLLLGLLRVVAAIAGLVWQTALFIAAWIVPALVWLFSLFHFGAGQSALESLFGRRRQIIYLDPIILAWLQAHFPVSVLLALVLSMIAAILSIWLAMRYRNWRNEAEDEERTSLWSWRLLWSQLLQALLGLRRSFRSGSTSATPQTTQPPPLVSSVRQLYAAALLRCRERERPRAPAVTPLEFEPALQDELGSALGQDLTATYVLARYAEADVPTDRVHSLRERWQSFVDSNEETPAPERNARDR